MIYLKQNLKGCDRIMLKNIESGQNVSAMDALETQLYQKVFPYEEIPKILIYTCFYSL